MINSDSNYLRKLLITVMFLLFPSISPAQSLNQNSTVNKCFKINGDTITVEKCYEETYDLPIAVMNKTVILNNSDSLYLINKLRFRYYEKLRSVLNDSLDFTNDFVILQYENLLRNSELNYNSLLENCESASKLFNKFMIETDSALKITSKSLELSEQSLESTMMSLIEAKELLEQERGIQLWDKFTIGIGGVCLGIVIALLAH